MPTPRDQLLQLLEKQDARVKRAFLTFVESVRSPAVMDELVARLQSNDISGALRIIDSHVARFATTIPEVIAAVGAASAVELDAALPDIALAITFDPTNPRAAALAASARQRLIREFSNQQHAATQQAISRAIARGAGTQEVARSFRDSIGLTANQEAYVNSYRDQLQTLNSRALDRALRDRRYDERFARALERDRPLTPVQIDVMVNRYWARAVASRADTIARTEALTAYSQAREEALQQMMEQTRLNRNRVTRVWYATHDDRVRLWHLEMDGQAQAPGDPFTDGLGNSLMYPGDPLAPPETRINCRCTLSWDIAPPDA